MKTNTATTQVNNLEARKSPCNVEFPPLSMEVQFADGHSEVFVFDDPRQVLLEEVAIAARSNKKRKVRKVRAVAAGFKAGGLWGTMGLVREIRMQHSHVLDQKADGTPICDNGQRMKAILDG